MGSNLKTACGAVALLALAVTAQAQSFGPVPQVSLTTNVPSYAAANSSIANTAGGDLFCLKGSATKTIFINVAHATATANASSVTTVVVNKYSSAPSGGTSTAVSAVALDSLNASATATVTAYTVSPTSGISLGTVGAHKIAVGVTGNTANQTEALWEYGTRSDQALVLRGTSQFACISVGSTGTGGLWAVYMKWTEQ